MEPPKQKSSKQSESIPQESVGKSTPKDNCSRYLIRLKFSEDILESGGDPIVLLKDFHEQGECYVTPHCHSIPDLEFLNPTKLYLHWSLVLSTTKTMKELEDILMFFVDEEGVEIKLIQGPPEETKIKKDINAGIVEPTTEKPRH